MKLNFFFLLFTTAVFSQNDLNSSFLDSISTKSLEELDKLTIVYSRSNDTIRVLNSARLLIKKASQKQNNKYLSRGYHSLYLIEKNYNRKLSLADSILYSAILSKDKSVIANGYKQVGNANYLLGNYDESLSAFTKSYELNYSLHNFEAIESIDLSFASIKKITGRHYEANLIEQEVLSKYEKLKFKEIKNKRNYLNLIYNIGNSNYYLKQYDSTLFYAKKGKHLLRNYKSDIFNTYFTRNEAKAYLGKLNYDKAILLFKKSLKNLDDHDLSGSYYFLGKAYLGKNNIDSLVYYYLKCDTLITNKRIAPYPQLKEVYKSLFSYYDTINDYENKTKYLRKYFYLDSLLLVRSSYLNDEIHSKYDLAKLKNEQKFQLQKRKIYRWVILTFFIIVILLIILLLKQRKKLKKQKNKIKDFLDNDNILVPEPQFKKSTNNKSLLLNDDNKKHLKTCINDFIKKKGYLDRNISLNILSERWDVKHTVLSKMLNDEMNIDYSKFIRTLRIKNAVVSLKENKYLLKYSISGLAMEFGFNSGDVFSRAFKEITKVKPSVFIDELKSHHYTNDNL